MDAIAEKAREVLSGDANLQPASTRMTGWDREFIFGMG